VADSAEFVNPTTSPTSAPADPGGPAPSARSTRCARSAGSDRPAAAGARIRPDNLTKRHPDGQVPAVEEMPRVGLPLAVPLFQVGARTGTALVLNVGTATPATVGVGGGLGDLVSSGIAKQRLPVQVLDSVLTVAMALITDWLRALAELPLRPRGLEVH
jgi:hypothetical protein